MSDFTDQWANRHDKACESTHIPMDVDEPCHCYRRWLEERLIELEKQDEIHWKTRRTLLKENERLEGRLGEIELRLRREFYAPEELQALAWHRATYPPSWWRRLLTRTPPPPAARPADVNLARLQGQLRHAQSALHVALAEHKLIAEACAHWFAKVQQYGRHLDGCPGEPCTCGFAS